jgi:BirA family biotin operon repressor/biotin-[acetyl-CoA-carboxylase] ligase
MIIGSKQLFYENVSSTNTEASLLLKAGAPEEGTVIYTDFQSAGRGQQGNRWESEKGRNLLISIILYPESVSPDEQFLISIMASLGICDMLDNYFQGSKIKWPNDIYAGDDKIAGILIENTIMGEKTGSTVIGIGLNINQTDFPDFLPDPVSMKMITGEEYDCNLIMNHLLASLDKRYKELLYGDREDLRKEYIPRLYRLGEWHNFRAENRSFPGKITDIATSGKLRIEKRDGTTAEFGFKEIEYIK